MDRCNEKVEYPRYDVSETTDGYLHLNTILIPTTDNITIKITRVITNY